MLIGKFWSELSRRWDARLHLQAWGPFAGERCFSISFCLMDQLMLVSDYSKNQSPPVQGVMADTLSYHPSCLQNFQGRGICTLCRSWGRTRVISSFQSASLCFREHQQQSTHPRQRLRHNQHLHSPLISKMGFWMPSSGDSEALIKHWQCYTTCQLHVTDEQIMNFSVKGTGRSPITGTQILSLQDLQGQCTGSAISCPLQ